MNSKFLVAEWRKLAIANYVIDPAILSSYIPYKTELDTWKGKCYISLVGFRFMNTKIRGVSIPFHRHFEEVNLRFYVRYKDSTGWKRGVTFIREIVPKRALTFVANTFYKEKYITLPMKHRWDIQNDVINISYSWKHNKSWNHFTLQADVKPQEIKSGSEEEFITEHYWGYTPLNKLSCSEYGVEHPRWLMYEVKDYKIDVTFEKLYGNNFAFLDSRAPESVMLAEGSEIIVRTKKIIN